MKRGMKNGGEGFIAQREYFPYIGKKNVRIQKIEDVLHTSVTPWRDNHLYNDYIYRSYGGFERGAVAKILGLDDSNLKYVPYYPYYMVHYKE